MFELVIESGVLITIILLLRKVFTGRVSYRFLYALWGVAVLRLLVPVTVVDAPISVMNVLQGFEVAENDRGNTELSTEKMTQNTDAVSDVVTTKEAEKGKSLEVQSSTKEDGLKQSGQNVAIDSEKKAESVRNTEVANVDSQGDVVQREVVEPEKNGKISSALEDNSIVVVFRKNVSGWLVLLWGMGVAVCLLVTLCTNLELIHRLKRGRERFFEVEDGQKGPAVYLTEEFSTPCLYGMLYPAIYIPKNLAEISSDEKLEQIILHEKIHYKHCDHIWAFIRMLLVSLYWFHPLVWLGASVSKKDAELACDEAVIAYLGEERRVSYGEMLIEVAQLGGQTNMLYSVTSMSKEGKNLEKRIRAISQRKVYNRKLILPFVVIVCLVVGITFTGKTNQGKTEVSNRETASPEQSAAKVQDDELTMEQLIAWEEEDAFGKLYYKDFISYQNYELSEGETGGYLEFPLEYKGTHYCLHVSFDKNKTVTELYLSNEDSGEWRPIYNRGYHGGLYQTTVEMMLEHKSLLDDYIVYDLPEGLSNGTCYMDYASYSGGSMRLFLSEEDQEKGVWGYTQAPVWSAAGGVTQTDSIVVNEENILHYAWGAYFGNGRGALEPSAIVNMKGGELEKVSGCDGDASIEGVEFRQEVVEHLGFYCWYQKPEGEEDAELPKKNSLFPRKVWLACLTQSGDTSGFGYVFFLDAEEYSKEEAVKLLRSARITGEGNIAHQNLLKKAEKVMPEAVVKELQSSGVVKTVDGVYTIGNDKAEPTLRLDFAYDSDILYQYCSKEYGFVDSLPEDRITKEEAETVIRRFAEEFLDKEVELTETDAYSGYETEDYVTYRDESGGIYLVQLSHNMLIRYDSPASNMKQGR